MTGSLEGTVTQKSYTGDGVVDSFNTTFWLRNKGDLEVQVVDTDDNVTDLVLDTDYTITGLLDYDGATVTLTAGPLTSGYTIWLHRKPPEINLNDFTEATSLFPSAVTRAIDYLTALVQYLQDQVNASVRTTVSALSGTMSGTTLAGAVARAGRFLGFDSGGDPVATGVTVAQVEAAVAAYEDTVHVDVARVVWCSALSGLPTLIPDSTAIPSDQVAIVANKDRGGPFRWDASSTDDADGVLIVANTDAPDVGRWKRLYEGRRYFADWWDMTAGDAAANYQAAVDATPDGYTLTTRTQDVVPLGSTILVQNRTGLVLDWGHLSNGDAGKGQGRVAWVGDDAATVFQFHCTQFCYLDGATVLSNGADICLDIWQGSAGGTQISTHSGARNCNFLNNDVRSTWAGIRNSAHPDYTGQNSEFHEFIGNSFVSSGYTRPVGGPTTGCAGVGILGAGSSNSHGHLLQNNLFFGLSFGVDSYLSGGGWYGYFCVGFNNTSYCDVGVRFGHISYQRINLDGWNSEGTNYLFDAQHNGGEGVIQINGWRAGGCGKGSGESMMRLGGQIIMTACGLGTDAANSYFFDAPGGGHAFKLKVQGNIYNNQSRSGVKIMKGLDDGTFTTGVDISAEDDQFWSGVNGVDLGTANSPYMFGSQHAPRLGGAAIPGISEAQFWGTHSDYQIPSPGAAGYPASPVTALTGSHSDAIYVVAGIVHVNIAGGPTIKNLLTPFYPLSSAQALHSPISVRLVADQDFTLDAGTSGGEGIAVSAPVTVTAPNFKDVFLDIGASPVKWRVAQ